MRFAIRRLVGVLVATTIVAYPSLAIGATFVVNSALDAVDVLPGNGVCATAGAVCTLRAAIQEANTTPGPHIITLPAGIYTLTIAGRGETDAATGDLNVKADITINGASAATTIVDGNSLDRVFSASSGGLTMNDLTVRNGNPGGGGGCISVSAVNLTLARLVVNSCRSDGSGGGILVSGPSTVTVTDATISQNVTTTQSSGGGIFLVNGITATITRATISGNSSFFGGGIRVLAQPRLHRLFM